MDFALMPPEFNSGRMYSGPGSAPLLVAAAAWDDVAAALHSTAASYSSAVSGLTAKWRGPAAATMATAAAPYGMWVSATAAQAEHAAAQARAAAAAFEIAFAATVPPPIIAANRAQLMALVATNLFGQNTPAIMATQAEYLEMWAQDAAAMYRYAASSAAASQLTPFEPPPHITNPAGPTGQAAAVTQASAAAAVAQTQTLPQLMSVVPPALQSLAAPAAATDSTALASSLNTLLGLAIGPTSPVSMFPLGGVPYLLGTQGFLLPQAAANSVAAEHKAAQAAGAGAGVLTVSQAHSLGAGQATAAVGRAGFVGGLSVPQGWTTTTEAIRPMAAVFTEGGSPSLPVALADPGEGSLLGNAAMSGLAGRTLADTGGARPAGGGTPAVAKAAGEVNIFLVPTGAK